MHRYADLRTAANSFQLTLDQMGPYCARYTRAGRHLLLAGAKGHVALLDWKEKRLTCETHVKDRVLDATFLHNETWFALAQSKYVHIYDKQGVELHVRREEEEEELRALTGTGTDIAHTPKAVTCAVPAVPLAAGVERVAGLLALDRRVGGSTGGGTQCAFRSRDGHAPGEPTLLVC